jgi:hypothetical protein
MLISFTTNFILFLFELIVCDKLATKSDTSWSICFIPLFILSFVSIGTCIWSVRYDRSYEIELFCALNILQFVFIALRLDYTINWSWVLVLIPIWIINVISLIILLYVIILAIIMTRNNQNVMRQNQQIYAQQNQKCSNAIYYTIFVFSVIIFEILLTSKLDHEMFSTNWFPHFHGFYLQNSPTGNNLNVNQNKFSSGGYQAQNQQTLPHLQQQHQQALYQHSNVNIVQTQSFLKGGYHHMPPSALKSNPFNQNSNSSAFYSVVRQGMQNSQPTQDAPTTLTTATFSFFLVTLPLYVAYFSLILLSFNSHSGNLWWFGMRRDFCELFLIFCPMFKIYGNIQLKLSSKFKEANSVEDLSDQFNNHQTNSANHNNSISIRPVNLARTFNTNVSTDLMHSNLASLYTEEQTPCLPNTAISIDNDLVSNEASILKFKQNMRLNNNNDSTTINTNNLFDASNGNQSINENNFSMDLESSSINVVSPSVMIHANSSASQARLTSDETSLANNNRSLQTGFNNSENNSSIENAKSLNALNQIYYSSNSHNETQKEMMSLNRLSIKKNANKKLLMQNNKTNNMGNIVKLDMPD